MVLSMMGLVTPKFLRTKRRHAIVLITVVASFITPGDVVVLTIMMMVPLVGLYELGIFLSWLIYRGKAQREKELEADLTPPTDSIEAQ
jgi:sec-independent protein translocase protein TatC